jgi:hypothetical protein
MGEFCNAYYQRTSLATDNFQRLFIARKSTDTVTVKVSIIANGKLSALVTPGRQATDYF